MTKTLRIPSDLERAILQSRQAAARPYPGIFGFGRREAKVEPLGPGISFWTISDDEELDEFLFQDVLGALYGSDVDLAALPSGYLPLVYVLEFERHCQFESWLAVSNRAEDMPRIIESYRFLGLGEEAEALSAVFDAYQTVDDDSDAYYDVLGKAYSLVPNKTSSIELRLPVIFTFVRSNPELFGEPTF